MRRVILLLILVYMFDRESYAGSVPINSKFEVLPVCFGWGGHPEKFALVKEGVDISIGVCRCIINPGEVFSDQYCRDQCPHERNGVPVDFKPNPQNWKIRYYNPITTEGTFLCKSGQKEKIQIDRDAFCYDFVEAPYKRVSSFSPIPTLFFDNQRYCVGKIFPHPSKVSITDPIGWSVFDRVWDYGYEVTGNRWADIYYVVRVISGDKAVKELIYRGGEYLEPVVDERGNRKRSGMGVMGGVLSILSIVGCSNAVIDDVIGDVVMDESNVCGVGRYPSFDYQCAGNIGCREINRDRCGCRCTRCDSDKCVEMSCDGECVRDVGVDVSDVLDYEDISDEDIRTDIEEVVEDAGVEEVIDVGIRDAEDGGSKDEIEYECEDLGDPVGMEFSGNLDEPIVYIAKVYMDAWITGDYVVWLVPGGAGGLAKDIYYLSLLDKRVRRVPNCDGYDYIDSLVYYKNKIYWSNSGNVCANGKACSGIWEFDLDRRDSPEFVSRKDAAYFPKVYEDNLVYRMTVTDNNPKNGTYYRNLRTGEDRKISDEGLLSDYSHALYKNLIVGVGKDIYTLNIDTFERKTHYTSDITFFANPVNDPLPLMPIIQFIGIEKYGHSTTDIFLLNIDTDELIRITDDETFQYAPAVSGNIIVFHENKDPKESDVSYGSLVVYDIERKVRRKVGGLNGVISTLHMNGSRVIYTPDIYSPVGRVYFVDLEKLGVIKDGHVVPE